MRSTYLAIALSTLVSSCGGPSDDDASVPMLSDASAPDASAPDASAPDASAPDASAPDASTPDATTSDVDELDASMLDASEPVSFQPLTLPAVGFWGAAMSGVGSGDYIAETASFSNIAFIRGNSEEEWHQKIDRANDHGLRAVLMIENVLFPWASTATYPDYEARLADFWERLGAERRAQVAGFYVFDEPYWKNTFPEWTTVAPEALKEELESIVDLLHVMAPERFTAIAFTHHTVSAASFSTLLPENLEMLGVNCYLAFGEECSEAQIEQQIALMLAAKSASQKLLLTMDLYASTSPTVATRQAMLGRARAWRRIVAPHFSEVGGIFPFLYQDHLGESIYGGVSMPEALTETTIYMESALGRLRCETDDLARVVDGVVIDRWVDAPYCVPTCVGNDLVRLDTLGREVDRWVNAPVCP